MLSNYHTKILGQYCALKHSKQQQCVHSQQPAHTTSFRCTALMTGATGTVADQSSGPLPPVVPPPFHLEAVKTLRPCRQGAVLPYSPIIGPDAWYGTDQLQQTNQWIHQLTAAQVSELASAVTAVQQQLELKAHGNYLTGLMRLRNPDDFALPCLAPVLAHMTLELTEGRGFFLIKGLPVDRWTREQVTIAYWGIGIHLGVAIPQNQKGHLLGHVKDVGVDSLCQNPTTRIYMTRAAQPWHVDSCDIVGLLCLQTAKSGGMSSWASSSSIYNEMQKSNPELLATLAGTWYLDRKGELPADKMPFYIMPILHFHQGHVTVSFHDTYYQAAAARFPDQVPPLTADQQQALQLFNSIANRTDVKLDYWLEPGDMQFVNNHNIVHMRTHFEDWEEPGKKRHLLRLQLVRPNLRPLPTAAFEELWGPLAADDRCAQQLAAIGDAVDMLVRHAGAGADVRSAKPNLAPASSESSSSAAAAPTQALAAPATDGADNLPARLAARFGGNGMGCIPLDAEIGNELRG